MKSTFKILCACAVGVAAAVPAWGITVAVSSGTLGALPAIDETDNVLVLEGTADIRDLMLLETLPGHVTELDMSRLRITRHTANRQLWHGRTHFEADELPALMLFASRLRSVVLPEGLRSIGDFAFNGCAALESVAVPASLESVGEGCFGGCPALVTLDLGATRVADIKAGTFRGCSALTSLTLPATVRHIGREAFAGSGVETLDVSGTETLDDFALAEMPRLRRVSLNPSGSYGRGVLLNCAALEAVSGAPAGVPELFAAECAALDAAAIVGGASTLGDWALAGTSAATVLLPAGLTEVGAGSLAGVKALASIDATALGSDVPTAADTAFDDIAPAEVALVVMADAVDLWSGHPVWGRFNVTANASAEVAGGNGVTFSLAANALTVACAAGIATVDVWSTDGMALYHAEPGQTEHTVDLGGMPLLLVVRVVTAGGEGSTTTILRASSL